MAKSTAATDKPLDLTDEEKARLLKNKTKNRTKFNQHWIVAAGIVSNHIIAFMTLFWCRVETKFVIAAILSGFLMMMGITAGYHRLWSHNSYVASNPLKVVLAVLGAASWQGSIRWWVIRHRMHHRFVDTKYDPYDSTRGLWFSHFGWLFERPKFYDMTPIINMEDINQDPVAKWNRAYTPHLVIGLGLILPLVLGWLMGDTIAGFLYIGIWGRIISWNGIFFVNSVCHHMDIGNRKYAYHSSANNTLFFALLSNGEANHNYHHEFPHDYRHGVKWSDYDPTKWLIWFCSKIGLAHSLVTVEDHVRQELENDVKVIKAREQLDRHLSDYVKHMAKPATELASLPVPTATALLPIVSPTDLKQNRLPTYLKKKGNYIVIDNFLIDVTDFAEKHPGGQHVFRPFQFKDATDMFFKGRNMHTKAAHRIVKRLRVAKVAAPGVGVGGSAGVKTD